MKTSEPSNIQASVLCSSNSNQLADWIKQAAVGNYDSSNRLYEHLAARMYRVIRKTVGPSNADDVMQEFVIHLFARLSQFRFESSFDTWAYRIAVNQCLQYLRKNTREKQRARQVAFTIELSHDATAQDKTEEVELLSKAMQRISDEQRSILYMKEVEGLSYESISSILEIPVGTVGSRLNKAKKELRDTMIEMGWD